MKMKKTAAVLAAAVMAAHMAVPAAAYKIENGAYSYEGYARFNSVDELAEYLSKHDEIVLSPTYALQEVYSIDALWIPVGFEEYENSIDRIYICGDYTSVRFAFEDGSYTLYDYGTGAEGMDVYDSVRAANGGSQKVNGRTVYRNGSKYCWKQGGRYFMLTAGDGSYAYAFCTAEELLMPERVTEGVVTISGKKYYVQADGSYYVGWKTLDGNKYFFGMDGAAVTKNTNIGNVRYTFDKRGVCTGTYTGWLTMDGEKYYCRRGRFVTGVYKIGGKNYTFGRDGVLIA